MNLKRRKFLTLTALSPVLLFESRDTYAFWNFIVGAARMLFGFTVGSAERRFIATSLVRSAGVGSIERGIVSSVISGSIRPAAVSIAERAAIRASFFSAAERKQILKGIRTIDSAIDIAEFVKNLEMYAPTLAVSYVNNKKVIEAIWVKENYDNHVVITFKNQNNFLVKTHLSITVLDVETKQTEVSQAFLLKAEPKASGGFSIQVADFKSAGLKKVSFTVQSDNINTPSSKTIFVV